MAAPRDWEEGLSALEEFSPFILANDGQRMQRAAANQMLVWCDLQKLLFSTIIVLNHILRMSRSWYFEHFGNATNFI